MLPKPRKTNEKLVDLITELKNSARENDAPIWKDVARRLEKPARNWAEVNLRKLSVHSKKGDTLLVPGKLLGGGELSEPVTVAAFSFSDSAKQKVAACGGSAITIPELVKKNPKGKGVRIIA